MRTKKWNTTKYKAVQDIERKKLYSKESNQKHSHFSILYINKFDLGLFCNVVKIQPKKIRKVELKELQRQRSKQRYQENFRSKTRIKSNHDWDQRDQTRESLGITIRKVSKFPSNLRLRLEIIVAASFRV